MITLWRAWYITPVVLLLLSSRAPCSWQVQESGVRVNLHDVCFVDSLHGWAAGDNSTVIATTDGGKTWRRQPVPVDSVEFREVLFVTSQAGFMGGSLRFQLAGRLGYRAIVLRTVDGGSHWEECDLGSGGEFYFADMDFLDTRRGWVAISNAGWPSYADREGIVLYTYDGGDTWHTMFGMKPDVIDAIDFWNDQLGYSLWLSGFDNFGPTYVYRTTDCGCHWELRGTIECCSLSSVAVVSPDTIVAYSPLSISFDGGLHWTTRWEDWIQTKPGRPETVWDLVPLGLREWCVLIVFPMAGTCSIFRTTDGGTTYTQVLPEQSPPLYALAALDANRLWAVGKSGAILAYRSSPTEVLEAESRIPQGFCLRQNFPNPFNSSTTITFSVPTAGYYALRIYDTVGREVAVLGCEQLTPGTYSHTWNGRDSKDAIVSSGVYVYELRSRIHTARREMVLIR